MNMFKGAQTDDWGIGTSPQYAGRKVSVIAIDGNRRQVSWNVPGEAEPTKHWVDVGDLKAMPGTAIPPKATGGVVVPVVAAEKEGEEILASASEGLSLNALLEPVIASKELDLAKQRDELAAENERLRTDLLKLTEDYDEKLRYQLERANGLLDERDKIKRDSALRIAQLRTALGAMPDNDDLDYLEHLVMHSMAELKERIAVLEAKAQVLPTVHRKIETKTVRNPGTVQIAEEINAGWVVVFETIFPTPYGDEYGPVSDESHIIRFERDIQDAVHPPLETAATQKVAGLEEAPSQVDPLSDEAPVPVLMEVALHSLADEPVWKRETDPVKQAQMIYAARKATVGQKAAGRMIAQTRARAKGEREQGGVVSSNVQYLVNTPPPQMPNGVKVGPLVLDPKKFPLAATIAMFGVDATTDALNNRIRAKMDAAKLLFQARMSNLPKLPPTLGAQS